MSSGLRRTGSELPAAARRSRSSRRTRSVRSPRRAVRRMRCRPRTSAAPVRRRARSMRRDRAATRARDRRCSPSRARLLRWRVSCTRRAFSSATAEAAGQRRQEALIVFVECMLAIDVLKGEHARLPSHPRRAGRRRQTSSLAGHDGAPVPLCLLIEVLGDQQRLTRRSTCFANPDSGRGSECNRSPRSIRYG